MLSFRVPDEDATEIQRWAEALGVDRSEILRDALHRHLVVLSGESDAEKWRQQPPTEAERSLSDIAAWGTSRGLDRLGRCRGVRSGSPARLAEIGRC